MDLQMNLEMMSQLYWMSVLYDTDKNGFQLLGDAQECNVWGIIDVISGCQGTEADYSSYSEGSEEEECGDEC